MRNQIRYRRAGRVPAARRSSRTARGSFALFKVFLVLIVGGAVLAGAWLGISKGYALLTQTELTGWHVKSVVVDGVSGHMHNELLTHAQSKVGQAFPLEEAGKLREEISKNYPMLKKVSVTRGLLNGKLKISAQLREPVAQFQLPNQEVQYVDKDSVVYTDPSPTLRTLVPTVEITGPVPQRLQPDFVELVQATLKLDRKLKFTRLLFDLQRNTITLVLADKSIIRFGKADHLKQKARYATQVLDYARAHQLLPASLNFDFFEDGKIFLTQASH